MVEKKKGVCKRRFTVKKEIVLESKPDSFNKSFGSERKSVVGYGGLLFKPSCGPRDPYSIQVE